MKTTHTLTLLLAIVASACTSQQKPESSTRAYSHVSSADGDVLNIGPNTMKIKVENDQWAMFEYTAAPGSNVPYHVYDDHDKVYMVREGEFTMKLNDKIISLKKGDVLEIPRGTKHAYINDSGANVKFDIVMTPGDVVQQFRDMDAYFKTLKGAPDKEKLKEITAKYGNRVVGPPLSSKE